MEASVVPVFIVVFLILINGIFVAAEFALIGVPRAAIEHRSKLNDRMAQRLHRVLTDRRRQDRYIATAQLGITLASLGLGMYGEHKLAAWLAVRLEALGEFPAWIAAHSIASVIAVSFFTYLHIVVGEMVPKSIALQRAEQAALWLTVPMAWFQTLLFPLVFVLNGMGNAILRLFNVRPSEQGHDLFHTHEELEFVIRESEEGGMLRKETSIVLQDLLGFGDLQAREVMVPRTKIVGIPVGVSNGALVEIIAADSHTRYPVYDGDLDHIVGSIHIKDFLTRHLVDRPVVAADAREIPFVPETAKLEKILRIMRRKNAQMVVVMDEFGGTAGLITMEDLFEEIVGEFEETDSKKSSIHADSDGSYVVKGPVRLDELGDELDLHLENENIDTVGGLVLARIGRPAKVGDTIKYRGLVITVTEIEGKGVARCRITRKVQQPRQQPSTTGAAGGGTPGNDQA